MREVEGDIHQKVIPNPNAQIPNKFKAPNSKSQCYLEIPMTQSDTAEGHSKEGKRRKERGKVEPIAGWVLPHSEIKYKGAFLDLDLNLDLSRSCFLILLLMR